MGEVGSRDQWQSEQGWAWPEQGDRRWGYEFEPPRLKKGGHEKQENERVVNDTMMARRRSK